MSTARQKKIDTYAAELTNIARVSIHQEELLKGIIRCIELYKDRIITKQQLDKEYKNAMIQVKYEIKIKQMKVESAYYHEVYKRLYNKTEYITISESDDLASEHPSDELLVIYDEYIYDDSLIDDIYIYAYGTSIEPTVENIKVQYINVSECLAFSSSVLCTDLSSKRRGSTCF